MEATRIDSLEAVRDALAPLVSEGFDALASGSVSDADLIGILRVSGDVRRLADALAIAATEQVDARSQGPRLERLTSRTGARNTNEVVRNATRCDARTATSFERAARLVHRDQSLTSGELLPAQFPMLVEALRDGDLGLPGLLAATGPLVAVADRVDPDGLAAADAALADAARGADLDGQSLPPLAADDLGNLARLWASHLDVDGAVPREDEALRRRSFRFGPTRDGLVPVYGYLLPEVASQFELHFDAILNPRAGRGPCFEPDGDPDSGELLPPKDPRTVPQKMHDALASILAAAARAVESPSLGGGAPTLVVTVSQADLIRGNAEGRVDGIDAPVSPGAVAHTACTGSIQRVIHDDEGRITSIHTRDRVFNATQRKAIMARDGGCVIPGCTVRAAWSEIHHITEHSQGGPTHTDNGCMLCWGHHRTLDVSGWQIRMRNGTVEIRGPAWWDRERRWRPARNNLTSLIS